MGCCQFLHRQNLLWVLPTIEVPPGDSSTLNFSETAKIQGPFLLCVFFSEQTWGAPASPCVQSQGVRPTRTAAKQRRGNTQRCTFHR